MSTMKRYNRKLPPHRYECLFCKKRFRWNKDLEYHMNIHTCERPYPCNQCDESFSSSSSCGFHIKHTHLKVTYKCDICGSKFSLSRSLCDHRKRVHKLKPKNGKLKTPQSCVIYPKVRNNSNKTKSRVGTRKPLQRGKQNRTAANCRRLDNEVKKKDNHKQTDAALHWNECSNKDSFQRGRNCMVTKKKIHRQKVRGGATATISQSQGGVKNRKSITNIEPNHEPKCIIPDSSFMSSSQSHSTDLPPFNYDYEILHKLMAQSRLEQEQRWDPSFFLHMNRYDPNDSCNAPSIYESTIKETEINVVTPTDHCSVQSQRGRPRKSLENNVSTVKPKITSAQLKKVQAGEIERLNGDQVKCPFCSIVLHTCNFKPHLMTHTGEKPFACVVCNKQFRQKSHLLKHIVRYHRYGRDIIQEPGKSRMSTLQREAEEDITCTFCGKRFNDKILLEKHILKGHNDKLQRKS